MGRTMKYRNAAEKQKAYRARKKTEGWSSELKSTVEVLRKKVRYIESCGRSAYIEVYKPMIEAGYWYAILDGFHHFARIDEATFGAVKPELTLCWQSHDTATYKFKRKQTTNTQESFS